MEKIQLPPYTGRMPQRTAYRYVPASLDDLLLSVRLTDVSEKARTRE